MMSVTDPDWDIIRHGQLNMAEMVWGYHQSLVSVFGEDNERVLELATAYQGQLLWLSSVFGGEAEAETDG